MLGELVAGGSTALDLLITHDKLCCANFITILNLTSAPYSNETGGSVALPVVLIVTRIITSYSYGAELIYICV
jgi:hypothetical protein